MLYKNESNKTETKMINQIERASKHFYLKISKII